MSKGLHRPDALYDPQSPDQLNTQDNYKLGLPAWAFPGWHNLYFNNKPSALASYASVFNTVEGNTTFYSTPDEKTVQLWVDAVADTHFQFCFKLPKTVTHSARSNQSDLSQFLHRIEPLGKHLGPLLLQFPATAGPKELGTIESIVRQLPTNFRYVLEVRHQDFFTKPELLEPLLNTYQLGRVMMDTRAIFRGNKHHPEVTAALHDKPDVPVLGKIYNKLVFVRLMLHPDLISNDLYIDQWTNRIKQALNNDCDCYMMIHCPNNLHCPPMALDFHERLRRTLHDDPISPLPSWPVPQQTSLL